MIRSTKTATHYKWGQACDGWHLLSSDSLSVIQERMPPGTTEERHRHRRAQQLFYILEGTASFELMGRKFEIGKSESFHVPPGAEHCIRNDSDSDLHFLVVSQPMAHGDRELSEDSR